MWKRGPQLEPMPDEEAEAELLGAASGRYTTWWRDKRSRTLAFLLSLDMFVSFLSVDIDLYNTRTP